MHSIDDPPALPNAVSHDVIVVGARTAGIATAMLLARRALNVLLIDHGARGAAGLDTDVLTRGGVLQLSRWGLLDEIIGSGTPPVRRTTFRYADDTVSISVKPSLGIDALYAPPHEVVAKVLRRAAAASGVDVRHGIKVTDLLVRDGRVVGVQALTPQRRLVELTASLVIGADGVRSTVAQRVGAGRSSIVPHPNMVTFGYWSDVAVDAYEWSFLPDARVGVIPTNDDRVCVFVSGLPSRIGRGGITVIRDAIAAGSPQRAADLAVGAPPQDVQTWRGHGGFVRRSRGPGWALVGTAGYFKDPTSAHGFTDALRDAELLARAVTVGFGRDSTLDDALEDYETTRDRFAVPIIDAVERIASHGRNDEEITHLLQQLSSAMADEVEMLARLEPGAVP